MSGCFKSNADDLVVVELNSTSTETNHLALFIHFLFSLAFSCTGLVLNACLLHIIMNKCSSAGKIKPMLMFSSVVDIIQSFATLIYSPVISASYGFLITFNNGLLKSNNWYLNNLFCCLTVSAVICGWICSPLQFLGRLHLLKHCKRPRGTQLSAYIFGTSLACLSATAITFYFYKRSSVSFLIGALTILENAGFPSNKNDVHGGNMKELRLRTYLIYLTLASIISNSVIVACWISKQKFLEKMTKRTQVSTSTKRMQSDLNRVFVALAVCPLVTNVVPTALHIFGISSCQNYPFLTLGCSLAFVSAPVLNPLTAMFFVRPYRRIVLYWLGLNRQPPQLQLAGGAIRHLPMLTTASGALPSIPRQLPYLQRAASTVDSTELNQNLNE